MTLVPNASRPVPLGSLTAGFVFFASTVPYQLLISMHFTFGHRSKGK